MATHDSLGEKLEMVRLRPRLGIYLITWATCGGVITHTYDALTGDLKSDQGLAPAMPRRISVSVSVMT